MRKLIFKQILGTMVLGAAVLAPLQIAGAAQAGGLEQSFDAAFAPEPASKPAPEPAPKPVLVRPAPIPQVAIPQVQPLRNAPASLPIPRYLARPDDDASEDSSSLAASRAPSPYTNIYSGPYANPVAAPFDGPLERRLLAVADGSHGRIGVAALDLGSGRTVGVLGDQPFPLASTAKVAIVATFLAGVDEGRFHLDDRYPLMLPVPSAKLSSAVAPARPGTLLPAEELIERAMTLSDNHATDGLLVAVGGPPAVDRWLRRVGLTGMRLDHNINTLVRDDGLIDPATTIDYHDSTTPQTMVRLLAGLYQGNWLSPSSREVLMGAMSRCRTGVHRMRLLLPSDALIGHKTGTLANTSSDVGIIRTPNGHTVALAIYVTGQGSKPSRESRIATIARTVYDGYAPEVEFASGSSQR